MRRCARTSFRACLPRKARCGWRNLSERYGMGFSPLREALNRLQSERLVTAESLRGFRVSPLSLAEFEDAFRRRLLIESEALRLSIAAGDDGWAAAIVAALYALRLQAGRRRTAIWTS